MGMETVDKKGWGMIRYLDLLTKWQDQEIEKRPGKSVCVVRYGGFGDMLQASSIMPVLKQQGYHITLNCMPKGYEIVKNNPYIDDFFIQEHEQVPNLELGPYWKKLASAFDKFVNLSESVEGTLLAIPGRAAYFWPQEFRHKRLNENYLEFTHELAGVPFEPSQKFYPTTGETAWAKKQKKKMGKVILWCLSGSSVHKTWPYLDTIVARIMTDTTYSVCFVGDDACRLLERGWEEEPRVFMRSGKWGIRKTLAFAQVADMVIGPETGVLNSVAYEKMPKVITLSHSSVENLTKGWVNTRALTPRSCKCYPCHQMHYNWDYCDKDETTYTARCQSDIGPEVMWLAVCEAINIKYIGDQ